MKVVFADSFYFFALVDPRDPSHDRAVAFSRDEPCRVVTTQFVLTELADGLARSVFGRKAACQIIEDLARTPNVRIVPFSDALFRDALDLYARRPDKHWSLTDCASFVVMQRDGIANALTGDHHFTQAGFAALLA